jgi:hypothetical protein
MSSKTNCFQPNPTQRRKLMTTSTKRSNQKSITPDRHLQVKYPRIIHIILAGMILVLAVLITFARLDGDKSALVEESAPAVSSNHVLEIPNAQISLDTQQSYDCSSRMDMFYACQNGLGQNDGTVLYSDVLEIPNTQISLDTQQSHNCPSRMDMLYACEWTQPE